MKFWLLKSEPSEFSLDDLRGSPAGTACWDGVRNYQARNFMRDEMRVGDGVLFYHSGGKPPAVAGSARVARKAYPDHTAWEPGGKHFDARSTPESPVWVMVDIQFENAFPRPVGLPELRRLSGLEGMMLLKRGMRLSVQPVTEAEFRAIVDYAESPDRPE